MAGKFMKVRKVVIPTLTLIAIMASTTPGAYAMTPAEATDFLGEGQTVVMEIAEVDAVTAAAPIYHDNGDNTYTVGSTGSVVALAGNEVVEVSTADKSVLAEAKVTDVSQFKDYEKEISKHWGKEDINYLVQKGAISGYTADGGGFYFAPSRNISRAEFTKIVVSLMDSDGSKTAQYVNGVADNIDDTNPLTLAQVQEKGFTWQASVVLAAHYNNASCNWGLDVAEWEKPITRGEMASVIVNLAEGMGGISLPEQAGIESSITDYTTVANTPYTKEIVKCYSNGIVSGDQNHNYNANNNGTRAEACAILSRLIDESRRVDVDINVKVDISNPTDQVSDQVQATTINQSDPYRRSVKEGDTFITTDGQKITVTKNPVTGTYNPEAAVGFDLGRDNIDGAVELGSVSDGSDGGVLGDVMLKGPNGHIAWTSTWKMIYNSGWDKPTTPGTSDGQRSPNKLYVWSATYQVWSPDPHIGSNL